jgi:hypothetical protein
MRLRLGWLLPLLLLALPARGQPYRPADSPADPSGGWKPSSGPWRVAERASLVSRDGVSWQIVVSERAIGTIPAGRSETKILLPRVVFRRIRSSDTTTVAVLLPTGNRDVGIYSPGSGEESATPSRMGVDDLGRWPNACKISILDAGGAIDLDRDGVSEIALRRFCSCSVPACAGILLVELDEDRPTLLDPASLVTDVALGRVVLEKILPGDDPATPVLQVAPEMLEECRLVAILGIRGSNDCPDCCRFPVFLRPRTPGAYEPYYDAETQSGWLKRAKDDIAAVAAGDAGRPLLSIEEAEMVRAAAFFYFTGAGAQTRGMISEGLGVRARDFRAQELLRRIEETFLSRPREGR